MNFISAFLEALKKEGFEIGIGTHLIVAEVLKNLPPGSSFETYRDFLCPVIAKSAAEQERFKKIFPKIAYELGLRTPFLEELDEPVVSSSSTKPVGNPPVKRSYQWIGLLLAGLIGAIAYFSYYLLNRPIPGCTDPAALNYNPKATFENATCIYPEPDTAIIGCMDANAINYNESANQPCNNCCEYDLPTSDGATIEGLALNDSTSFLVPFEPQELDLPFLLAVNETFGYKLYQLKDLITWILIAAILGIVLSILLYKRARKRYVARKERGDEPPYRLPIKITQSYPISFEAGTNVLLNQFRGREPSERRLLDVHKTIGATIKKGGLLEFKFKNRSQPIEYLILIDKSSEQNHQSQLFEYIYQLIASNEIYAERYFFEDNPSICWNDGYPSGIRLEKIIQKHYKARLLVFANAYSFINPTKGKLEPWVRELSIWQNRAILTPTPSSGWNYREAILANFFEVLPNTIAGLSEIVHRFEALKDQDLAHWKYNLGVTDPIITIHNDTIDADLNHHFSPEMQKWIAACAVYPEIHWDLTLSIGKTLNEKVLLTYDNIRKLGQLEWFKEGEMPDSVRSQLFDRLTEEERITVRSVILEILQKNIPKNKESLAYEEYQMHLAANQLLVNQMPKEKQKWIELYKDQFDKGIDNDFIAIKELDQQFNKVLDFQLPDGYWKLFYHNGQKIQGSKSWVTTITGAALMGILFLINSMLYIGCYEKENLASIPENTSRYCLESKEDSLAFHTLKGIYFIERNDLDSVNHEISLAAELMEFDDNTSQKKFSQSFLNNMAWCSYNKALEYYNIGAFENSIEILDSVFFRLTNKVFKEELKIGDAIHMLGIAEFYQGHLERAARDTQSLANNRLYREQIHMPNLFHMLKYDFVDTMAFNRIRVSKDGNYGFLDEKGTEKWTSEVPPYEHAFNYTVDEVNNEPRALITQKGTQCFIDLDGNVKPESCFSNLRPIKCSNELWGYVNDNGIRVLPCQYEEAGLFSLQEELAKVSVNGKYGFIRKNGQPAVPIKYDGANSFEEGYAAVRLADKWGYINERGQVTIPFRFDVVNNFSNGVAVVEIDINRFRINKEGNCIDGNQCPTETFVIEVQSSKNRQPISNATLDHNTLGNFITDQYGRIEVEVLEHLLPMSPTFYVVAPGYNSRNIRITLNQGRQLAPIVLEALTAESIDLDNDGIPNLEDECPEAYGLESTNGCPDADEDGVPDKDDRCPETKGSTRNFGCPLSKPLSLKEYGWLNGTWITKKQIEDSYVKRRIKEESIELTVDVENGKFTAFYPHRTCYGEWMVLQSKEGRTISFREKITEHQDRCYNNALIDIEYVNQDELSITFLNEDQSILFPKGILVKSQSDKDESSIEKEGVVYPIVNFQGNLWLGKNLDINVPGASCYDNKNSNCNQFGRLYTLSQAKRACAVLGPGWRLPTINEWENLLAHYGAIKRKLNLPEGDKQVYKALIPGGSSKLALTFGGVGEAVKGGLRFKYLGKYGRYLSTSEQKGQVQYVIISKDYTNVNILVGEKERLRTCRCVKSIEEIDTY